MENVGYLQIPDLGDFLFSTHVGIVPGLRNPIESRTAIPSQELRIGTNRVTVTGDTILIGDPQDWDEAGLRELLAHFERVHAQHGRLYIISQTYTAAKMSTEARRLLAKWHAKHVVDLVVVVGAGVAVRGLLALVIGATRLLGGRALPVQFCNRLVDATALMNAARKQYLSSK